MKILKPFISQSKVIGKATMAGESSQKNPQKCASLCGEKTRSFDKPSVQVGPIHNPTRFIRIPGKFEKKSWRNVFSSLCVKNHA